MNAKPMRRREFLQLTAGAIGGATLLAACQPVESPAASDEGGGAAAEGIQLEYLGYEPDEVHGEAFDKFKDVMPDVDILISPTIGSWPDMLAKINARIAAGDPPRHRHRGHLWAAQNLEQKGHPGRSESVP